MASCCGRSGRRLQLPQPPPRPPPPLSSSMGRFRPLACRCFPVMRPTAHARKHAVATWNTAPALTRSTTSTMKASTRRCHMSTRASGHRAPHRRCGPRAAATDLCLRIKPLARRRPRAAARSEGRSSIVPSGNWGMPVVRAIAWLCGCDGRMAMIFAYPEYKAVSPKERNRSRGTSVVRKHCGRCCIELICRVDGGGRCNAVRAAGGAWWRRRADISVNRCAGWPTVARRIPHIIGAGRVEVGAARTGARHRREMRCVWFTLAHIINIVSTPCCSRAHVKKYCCLLPWSQKRLIFVRRSKNSAATIYAFTKCPQPSRNTHSRARCDM